MKNKLLILKLGLILIWLALNLACGALSLNKKGGNTSVASNTAKTENANTAQTTTNSNADSPMNTANKMSEAANAINLPPPNPVENGKPQSFYSNTVFFTVPKDWKKIRSNVADVLFESPDKKFSLELSVTNREQKGTMMDEYSEAVARNNKRKISLMNLGNAVGILELLDDAALNDKQDYMVWESYPPPVEGMSLTLSVGLFFPHGEFEQHKQFISDLYHEVRIKK